MNLKDGSSMTAPVTEDPIVHPEEMRGSFELRLGEKI